MKLNDLSDKELAKSNNIKIENVNRKVAAMAILAILKKYKLSISDIPELGLKSDLRQLGVRIKCHTARTAKLRAGAKKTDKRVKVAYKYKTLRVQIRSGRGRTPRWVNDILENNKITITQFKADKRYKI